MQTVIIVIHLMIVSALIGVVLLQRSEGGGLGMGGGGGGGGFMTGRGTANLLTRTTAFLAIGFFITSLFLSWLAGLERKPASIIDTTPGVPTSQSPAPPTSNTGAGGLLDTLRQQEQKQAPAGGPQVPRSQ